MTGRLKDPTQHPPLVSEAVHPSTPGTVPPPLPEAPLETRPSPIERRAAGVVNALHLGLAESYMAGLEIPDSVLRAIFDSCMPLLYRYPALLIPYDWVLQEATPLAEGSGSLMQVQYNLPVELFRLMVGDSPRLLPKYSMGLWETGAQTLEEAQRAMLEDAIAKAEIQDGDTVLDIGCGWGAAAHYLLCRFPHVRVTGLNLSHAQCDYLRQKMTEPGNPLGSDRFTLVEADFNQVQFPQPFDRIISLGVFEHISNLTQALAQVATLLKPEGTAFIHLITVRFPHNVSSAFTHRYIFPYGRYWHFEAIPQRQQHLVTVQQWYLNGLNYARTFTAWLHHFDAHQDRIKTLDFGMDYGRFRRMWRFYLIWFACNFACRDGQDNGNGQYLLRRA